MSGRRVGTVDRRLDEGLLAVANSVAVAALHLTVAVIEVLVAEMEEILPIIQRLMMPVWWIA